VTTRSSLAAPDTATTDDYTYDMQVHARLPQIIDALTDGTVIGRWWTAVTGSERHGDEVRLFVGDHIAFRHVGLRPALECFDQCRAGWNHFMPSLVQFLETGVGRPNEPRDASA